MIFKCSKHSPLFPWNLLCFEHSFELDPENDTLLLIIQSLL